MNPLPFRNFVHLSQNEAHYLMKRVLSGDMSLVGPRPCTVHEFQRYQPWQRERVIAWPGLTGNWQVTGKNKTTFTEMIQMDIFYSRNLSFRMDLTILWKTLPSVMSQLLETRLSAGVRGCLTSPAVGQQYRKKI